MISAVFTPFSIPFLAFLVLFIFSYLRIMPLQYKLIVLGVVYCFTILMPTLTIFIFRKSTVSVRKNWWNEKEIHSLYSDHHFLCILPAHDAPAQYPVVHDRYHTLRPGSDDNLRHCQLKWKLSEHMAGAGAVIGGLVAFSALFSYNPVWWLCLFILVAGVLGTARIILRHHTLGEVMGGFAVGLICSLLVLHPLSNILFRIFLF